MCKFFGVSKAGYYKCLNSNKDKDFEALEHIRNIQNKCKQRYGYRRVQITLARQGIHYNHKKVLRIMNKYNLLSKIRRKNIYIRASEATHKYENILSQNFSTKKINEKWLTDISYIITPEGRLYLSVIRDAHDGYIIAYKYSTVQSINLVTDTIKIALAKERADKTILHSDQGFQYTSREYNKLAVANGITPSMSRKATPLDNAPVESFFSIFKTECIYLEKPKTITQAKELCDEFIDFYNYERLQLKHKSTPYEVRQKNILLVG